MKSLVNFVLKEVDGNKVEKIMKRIEDMKLSELTIWLNGQNVEQLKITAKEHKIKIHSKMKKTDIMDSIFNYFKNKKYEQRLKNQKEKMK